MREDRVAYGQPPRLDLAGSVLAQDVRIAGLVWTKGRRLTAQDLVAIAAQRDAGSVSVLVPGPGDIHEDEAAVRLALAVTGALGPAEAGLAVRGPVQSRVDLIATVAGVVSVRTAALARLNRIDPLEVFTVEDGRVVGPGDLVASAKVGPFLVAAAAIAAGEAAAGHAGPVVRVRAFQPVRIAALVKEKIAGAPRARFQASVMSRVAGLGAVWAGIQYVPDDAAAVINALRLATKGPGAAAIVLTAGGRSGDPADPFFVAVEALGGRVVRHGVPAHPGSMLWLARIGRVTVLGLPSCGAYSKATAADLLLPRLVAGYPPTAATVAALGHGGILDQTQRYRFPAYARTLDGLDD